MQTPQTDVRALPAYLLNAFHRGSSSSALLPDSAALTSSSSSSLNRRSILNAAKGSVSSRPIVSGKSYSRPDARALHSAAETTHETESEPARVIDTSNQDRCGNGITAGKEDCDDGNTLPGDGCSPTCTVETGYHCNGQPSHCYPT